MKKLALIFIISVTFLIHGSSKDQDDDSKYQRKSKVIEQNKNNKEKPHYHSPGIYSRSFSPKGTTLIIKKNNRPNREPMQIKLSPKNIELCKQTQPSTNSNDQKNQQFNNKK
jgi:hypothetical protein